MSGEDGQLLQMIQSGGVCNEAAGCHMDFLVPILIIFYPQLQEEKNLYFSLCLLH